METTGLYARAQGAFTPLDERAQQFLVSCRLAQKVLLHCHSARWPEHNALAHVIFAKLGEGLSMTPENVKLWLKWESGFTDIVMLPNSKRICCERSLRFESLPQAEFQLWWDDALEIIKEQALPRLPQEIFEEVRRLIIGNQGPRLMKTVS